VSLTRNKIKIVCPGIAAAVVLFALQAGTASACSVCMGAAESPLKQGLAWGVFTLLAVVMSVLGAFTVFFIHLARRAALVASGSFQASSEHPVNKT
jgi:hypothetical protein